MSNPTIFRWQAPQTNEDGTPIDYSINYELGELQGTSFVAKATIVGALQPDEFYEAPVGSMEWAPGEHTVALRAINADEPTKVSGWSNSVTFLWSDRVPNPPLLFSVV